MVVAERIGHQRGAVEVPKTPDPSSRMPKATTVKLERDTFEDVWWVCRIEGKSPGELIKELCGVQAGARRKRYESEIAKLKRLDDETTRLEAQARERGSE